MGIIIEMNLLSLTHFSTVRSICGISSKISSYLVPKSFLAMCNVPFEFLKKKKKREICNKAGLEKDTLIYNLTTAFGIENWL